MCCAISDFSLLPGFRINLKILYLSSYYQGAEENLWDIRQKQKNFHLTKYCKKCLKIFTFAPLPKFPRFCKKIVRRCEENLVGNIKDTDSREGAVYKLREFIFEFVSIMETILLLQTEHPE